MLSMGFHFPERTSLPHMEKITQPVQQRSKKGNGISVKSAQRERTNHTYQHLEKGEQENNAVQGL